ncbi:hypothetical protein NLR14_25550, partial [Escherichia coli]|nr:hypothetical protein [Escherichia coli]
DFGSGKKGADQDQQGKEEGGHDGGGRPGKSRRCAATTARAREMWLRLIMVQPQSLCQTTACAGDLKQLFMSEGGTRSSKMWFAVYPWHRRYFTFGHIVSGCLAGPAFAGGNREEK